MARAALWLTCTLLALSLALGGCKRKPEDLEVWRNAEGGVEKLAEWLASPDETPAVRQRALQILIEDGELSNLPAILERIADEPTRRQLATAAVDTIEAMWAKQDMPRITEELKKQGGDVAVGRSLSVFAKDAAYLVFPYVDPAAQPRLQAILKQWVAEDHELRDQLGNARLSQLLPRAGEGALDGVKKWLTDTSSPGTVARSLRTEADEATKRAIAQVIAARAEKEHPEISPELSIAILDTQDEAIIPYLQKAIIDPATGPEIFDPAMQLMIKIQGERAATFFVKLVSDTTGVYRWAAANQLILLRGKAGFLNLANSLPLEPQTYAVPEPDAFKRDTLQICNLLKTEMEKQQVKDYSDAIKRAIEAPRWPSRVLGLRCAEASQMRELLAQVEALRQSREAVPAWGEPRTIGQIATEVATKLAMP